MNLSEIRKKAQQEKRGGVDLVASTPSGNETVEAATAVNKPAAPTFEANVDLGIQTAAPPPFEAPSFQEFDPMAVLLAGRAAACPVNGTGTSADLLFEDNDEDFQELLCFKVATEKYAVNIMEIKEIIKPREVTEVPRVPDFVKGILSLRGIIIPVFNMRKRLGHAVEQKSGRERILVVNKGEEFCGILVDEVIQVARLATAAIEPPPAVLEGIDRDFVNGIGRYDGQMLILLNLENILDMNLF
jgi:purine-binding chemotaxis protein CheW